MKSRLKLFLLISFSYIFINNLMAEDDAKKESFSKEKIELGDLAEYSGMLVNYNKKGPGEPIYFLSIKEKLSVKLPNQLGDKKIECEQFVGKQVVVKGKYGGEINESKDLVTILLTNIISLELKDSKVTSSKNTEEKKNEENKPKSEIKDIEVVGFLSKIYSSKDLPPGSKEKTSWYVVEIKGGYLIHLPEKIENKEIDFKQYEGKEVIVKGKGNEVIEKTENAANVVVPNFTSLISINIKTPISIKDEKSPDKK